MDPKTELFYRDPYLKQFDASVVSCSKTKDGFEIMLSCTAFYPEGGGQPADHGLLDAVPVTHVKRRGNDIIHLCNAPLEVGSKVTGKINWDRRFDNMQNHTAEHIFSGIIHNKFGFENVGFHMDDDFITVDFNGELTDEQVSEVEKATLQAISDNQPVKISFPSAEELQHLQYRSKKELSGDVRIVDAGEFDRCACCGTHVKSTGEIGAFKVLESGKHRGGTRILIVAGQRAFNDHAKRISESKKISALLSAKPCEISKAVSKLLADDLEKQAKNDSRTRKYFELLANTLKPTGNLVLTFEEDLTPFELKRFAGILKEHHPSSSIAVLSIAKVEKPTFNYVLILDPQQAPQISKLLNQKLSGRGGGRDGIIQGSYQADRDEIEKVLKEQLNA